MQQKCHLSLAQFLLLPLEDVAEIAQSQQISY